MDPSLNASSPLVEQKQNVQQTSNGNGGSAPVVKTEVNSPTMAHQSQPAQSTQTSAHATSSQAPSQSAAQQHQQQPAQQPVAQQQQHTDQRAASYPSPASYASPGQYAYAQPPQQTVDQNAYRASPTGSNGSLSLPSMRSLDPLQGQQQQQQQPMPQQQLQQPYTTGAPMPLPSPLAMPYYHSAQTLPHPGYGHQVALGGDPNANIRYALPPTDHRVMSGGRHKKEIKRRTKTGCLTCRKRRIKCDEQHPACRNCQKSKRDCLGYDPIFKQQPGPASIQPAPTSAPVQASTLATANPYGNQPSMLTGYPVMSSYDPNMPHSAQNFDYNASIDPALDTSQAQYTQGYPAGTHPHSYDQNSHISYAAQPGVSYPAPGYDQSQIPRTEAGSYYPSYPAQPAQPAYTANTSAVPGPIMPPPKPVKIDELLIKLPSSSDPSPESASNGGAEGAKPFEPEQSTIEEIRQMYLSIYIPGLESFLESRWFSIEGTATLMKDPVALDHFAKLLQQFMKATECNEAEMAYAYQIEVRVVWELAQMVNAAEEKPPKAADALPSPEDANEAALRLKVFQHLITGEIAERNDLTRPVGQGEHHKMRELDFWYSLGRFVTLPIHSNDASSSIAIDETLSHLRNLLDGRENRDVLYSIAVVRALGQRVSEYDVSEQPLHLDEQDARSKLSVAKRFVGDESLRGTTNVIRRFCELACRALGFGGGVVVQQ